jgi:hypothetical protein
MRAFTEAYEIPQERTGSYGAQKHPVSVSDRDFRKVKRPIGAMMNRNHKRGEQNQNDKTQREKVM